MPAAQFVHGAGGGGWEWNVWLRVFAAAGYQVRAPDLLPAPQGPAQTGLTDYSSQLRTHLLSLRQELVGSANSAAADRHDGDEQKIVLVGASLGGLLALLNAEFADALVLINPMPPAPLNLRLADRAPYPSIIPWGVDASLEGTRRTLPDADDAACIYAFRRWRDESGAVMNAVREGIVVAKPRCRLLVIASEHDSDIPATLSQQLANQLDGELDVVPDASHVGPLLGRSATVVAKRAVAWLNSSGSGN